MKKVPLPGDTVAQDRCDPLVLWSSWKTSVPDIPAGKRTGQVSPGQPCLVVAVHGELTLVLAGDQLGWCSAGWWGIT